MSGRCGSCLGIHLDEAFTRGVSVVVKDHVNSVNGNVTGMGTHKISDVIDRCFVWEAAKSNTVTLLSKHLRD